MGSRESIRHRNLTSAEGQAPLPSARSSLAPSRQSGAGESVSAMPLPPGAVAAAAGNGMVSAARTSGGKRPSTEANAELQLHHATSTRLSVPGMAG